jgi:hypothetical protein
MCSLSELELKELNFYISVNTTLEAIEDFLLKLFWTKNRQHNYCNAIELMDPKYKKINTFYETLSMHIIWNVIYNIYNNTLDTLISMLTLFPVYRYFWQNRKNYMNGQFTR